MFGNNNMTLWCPTKFNIMLILLTVNSRFHGICSELKADYKEINKLENMYHIMLTNSQFNTRLFSGIPKLGICASTYQKHPWHLDMMINNLNMHFVLEELQI